MKHHIIKFLSVSILFLTFSVYGHDLKTPKGSSVPHSHPSDTGWQDPPGGDYHTADYWTTWADGYWHSMIIERIDRANQAYNCHAYAWPGSRQSDANSWCWIEVGSRC
jgi:hypothetical protein